MTGATPYVVERIAPRAANYLGRLPRNQQEAVAEAIHYLCNTSPFHHTNPTTIKELKGNYIIYKDNGDTVLAKFASFIRLIRIAVPFVLPQSTTEATSISHVKLKQKLHLLQNHPRRIVRRDCF